MRIAIIGGLDRNARDLEDVARSGGHQLETHTGVVAGRASSAHLRAMVARADLVFILTDINSHNGVQLAKRVARQHHRPVRILRRLAPAHLAAYFPATEASPGNVVGHDIPLPRAA